MHKKTKPKSNRKNNCKYLLNICKSIIKNLVKMDNNCPIIILIV